MTDAEMLKNLCMQLRAVFEHHRDEAQRRSADARARSLAEISSDNFDMIAGYNAEALTWQRAAEVVDRAESAWTSCSRCEKLTALTTAGGVCPACVSGR